MADFQHYKASDPRHVSRGQAFSVHNWMCVACQATAATPNDAAPWCVNCGAYSMRKTGHIEDSKVAEIKSRKAPEAERTEKGRKGRMEDGLVSELKGVVRPRSGSTPLLISVNMDTGAFLRRQAFCRWGDVSFLTSVEEFGAAFTPFDPTPSTIILEAGGDMTIKKEVRKAVTHVGPVSVEGGKTRKMFEDGLVVFTHGSQRAVFAMSDIANVLINAI